MLKLLFTCLLSLRSCIEKNTLVFHQSGGCLQHNLLAANLTGGNHRLSVNWMKWVPAHRFIWKYPKEVFFVFSALLKDQGYQPCVKEEGPMKQCQNVSIGHWISTGSSLILFLRTMGPEVLASLFLLSWAVRHVHHRTYNIVHWYLTCWKQKAAPEVEQVLLAAWA